MYYSILEREMSVCSGPQGPGPTELFEGDAVNAVRAQQDSHQPQSLPKLSLSE